LGLLAAERGTDVVCGDTAHPCRRFRYVWSMNTDAEGEARPGSGGSADSSRCHVHARLVCRTGRHMIASISGFHAFRRIDRLLLPWAALKMSSPVRRYLALLLTAIFVMSAGMLRGGLDNGDSADVFASLAQERSFDHMPSCPDGNGVCGGALNHGRELSDCSAMSCAVLWPTRDPMSAERNARRLTFRLGHSSIRGSRPSRLDRPPRLT